MLFAEIVKIFTRIILLKRSKTLAAIDEQWTKKCYESLWLWSKIISKTNAPFRFLTSTDHVVFIEIMVGWVHLHRIVSPSAVTNARRGRCLALAAHQALRLTLSIIREALPGLATVPSGVSRRGSGCYATYIGYNAAASAGSRIGPSTSPSVGWCEASSGFFCKMFVGFWKTFTIFET